MVKTSPVKNFGKFGKLQTICQSFLPIFTAFNRISHAFTQTYGLLFMVAYFPLVYQNQVCSTVVTSYQMYFYTESTLELTITSPVTFVMIQLSAIHRLLHVGSSYTTNIVLYSSNQCMHIIIDIRGHVHVALTPFIINK